jgi:hypothetical protein
LNVSIETYRSIAQRLRCWPIEYRFVSLTYLISLNVRVARAHINQGETRAEYLGTDSRSDFIFHPVPIREKRSASCCDVCCITNLESSEVVRQSKPCEVKLNRDGNPSSLLCRAKQSAADVTRLTMNIQGDSRGFNR